jgi:hypothetical protein
MPVAVEPNQSKPNKVDTRPFQQFRLLVGTHCEGEKDEDNRLIMYKQGDIVETKSDLCAKFNSVGSVKFERIETENAQLPLSKPVTQAPGGSVKTATPAANPIDTFEAMSVEELKKHAEQEEINLGKAATKPEIIKVLRSAYGS